MLTSTRDIWFTMTIANNIEILTKIVELNEAFVEEWKANNDPDFINQCMFQSIPTIFSELSAERGGNVMGLDKLDKNVIMLNFNVAVRTADKKAIARPLLRSYGERMQEFAASKDGLVDWQYLNYADSYQDPLGSYGSENVEKLRAVARKFDPQGVFQTKVPGGFKISRVGIQSDSTIMDEALYDNGKEETKTLEI